MVTKRYFTTRKMVTLAILSALATPLMFIEIAPVPVAPWLKFDFSDIVVYVSAVIYGPIGAIIVAFIKSIIHYLIKGSDVGIPLPQFIAFVSSLAYVLPFYYIMVLVKRVNNIGKEKSKLISLIFSFGFILISITSIQYLLMPVIAEWFNWTIPTNRLLWILTYLGAINVVVTTLIVYYLNKKVEDDQYYLIRFIPVLIGTLSLTVILTFLNYIWFTRWYLALLNAPLPERMIKFVAEVYAPFNFTKGMVLSILFILLSYRLDEVVSKIVGDEEQYIELS